MNQKKCPKCGELNPPEAVMCWACYTPLTGPATAAAAGGGALAGGKAVAAATAEEEVKKPAATPAQMGIIGVALLVGVLYGGYAMFGGSSDVAIDNTISNGVAPPEFDQSGGGTTQQSTVSSPLPPAPGGGGSTGTTNASPPAFQVVAAPSPNYSRGTMGILALDNNLSQPQARDLARKAIRALASNRWKPLSVYVFKDADAASAFKEYQSQHGNKPLGPDDYPNLTQVWARTYMYYQYLNGKETMQNPSSNASGWWTRRT